MTWIPRNFYVKGLKMTQKQYRTAQGKVVDIGALQLRNENVRAVGNMPVNSRGDMLDAKNRPIDTRNQQVARQYRKQVNSAQGSQVHSSKRAQSTPVDIPVPPEDFQDDFVKPTSPVVSTEGLAAAISRARNK
jgi:hypothetical protein